MLIGIIGKANVGKSTFFKSLTLADILIANYPFATIDPNKGFGHVSLPCIDKEFNTQCNPRTGFCINHIRFVPVEVMDVAGLVPGASEGKGMGNKFLDDLRQADGFIQVLDISGSTNEKGEPTPPLSYDPANDIKWVDQELNMWYYGILEKGWNKLSRQIQQEKKKASKVLADQLSGLNIKEDDLKTAITRLSLDDENPMSWTNEQLFQLGVELRKLKPCVIAANKMDIPGAEKNFERLQKEFPDKIFVPVSAEMELALKEASKNKLIKYMPGDSKFEILEEEKLNDKQKAAIDFMRKFLEKYKATGVQQSLNTLVLEMMKYICIFPGGVGKLEDSQGRVLPDCFLMPPKTTALDFAYKLHTDFGDNFIRAIDVKKKMPIGKDHLLKNGDVVEIVSGK